MVLDQVFSWPQLASEEGSLSRVQDTLKLWGVQTFQRELILFQQKIGGERSMYQL